MKKLFLVEIPITICIFYTVLSIINSILIVMDGNDYVTTNNIFTILLWCTIGTVVVFGQRLLPNLSPPVVIIIQYTVALSLVLLSIYIWGLFEPLHPDAYRNGFKSFTIPFILGAGAYYFELWRYAKKQNELLQEVKNSRGIRD